MQSDPLAVLIDENWVEGGTEKKKRHNSEQKSTCLYFYFLQILYKVESIKKVGPNLLPSADAAISLSLNLHKWKK